MSVGPRSLLSPKKDNCTREGWMMRRLVAVCMALAVFAACGDDGEGDPITIPPTISLTLGSASVTLTQGTTATVGLSVSRTGNVGDVTISVGGLPAGVTAAPLTLASGVTTGTLTLTAAANAAVGGAAATVTAGA